MSIFLTRPVINTEEERNAKADMHLGELLVREIIEHAKQAGFKEMVLDTVAPLNVAIGLYKKNGFVECEPYYNNPMDDVIYMMKKL